MQWTCANCHKEAGHLENPHVVDDYLVCQHCQMILLQQRTVETKVRHWLWRLPIWARAMVVVLIVASSIGVIVVSWHQKQLARRQAIYRECAAAVAMATTETEKQFPSQRHDKLDRGDEWTLSKQAVVFKKPDDLYYETTGTPPWTLNKDTKILITRRVPVENGIWYEFVTRGERRLHGWVTNHELSKQDADGFPQYGDTFKEVRKGWYEGCLQSALEELADKCGLTVDELASIMTEGNSNNWPKKQPER